MRKTLVATGGRFGHVDGDGLALRRAAKRNAPVLLLTTTVATFVLAFWILNHHPASGLGEAQVEDGGLRRGEGGGLCVWLSLAGEKGR